MRYRFVPLLLFAQFLGAAALAKNIFDDGD
jgi:hypothetical protein